VGHLNCGYLTNLDLAVAKGELEKPFYGIRFSPFQSNEAL
jgi:hypothetical protein